MTGITSLDPAAVSRTTTTTEAVLITGGAGSIGSAVAARLGGDGWRVGIMDLNEEAMWRMRVEFPGRSYLLGDVTVPGDCKEAAAFMGRRPLDLVHCAAVKHVWTCEGSPMMAQRVNFNGTLNMLGAVDAERFVLVSTDKALDPCSRMGRSKQQAERMVLDAGGRVVRFGNVIGTRGSLLPAVARFRDLGLPIPITDKRMTRFVMTEAEAVDTVLRAMEASPGTVTIPENLRSVNIHTFLEVLPLLLGFRVVLPRVFRRRFGLASPSPARFSSIDAIASLRSCPVLLVRDLFFVVVFFVAICMSPCWWMASIPTDSPPGSSDSDYLDGPGHQGVRRRNLPGFAVFPCGVWRPCWPRGRGAPGRPVAYRG